jgi:hypothetical protein
MMYPGGGGKFFPRPDRPSPQVVRERRPVASCSGDTLVVSWRDAVPGAFQVADGPVLEIQDSTAAWGHAAWDDDRYVEVRALRTFRKSALWELRWAAPGSGVYRLVLLPRADGATTATSNSRPCGRR